MTAHLYAVTVTLPATATDLDHVLEVVSRRLAGDEVSVVVDADQRPVLRLTVGSDDLWLTLLLTMNAVTATGYAPESVSAHDAGLDRTP